MMSYDNCGETTTLHDKYLRVNIVIVWIFHGCIIRNGYWPVWDVHNNFCMVTLCLLFGLWGPLK